MNGAVVLVTGASGGIGRCVARRLAERGASVVAHYHRDRDAAQHLVRELPGEGHLALAHDLSDPASSGALIEAVADRRGRLDVLVNNAGIAREHPIADIDFAQWRAAWEALLAMNLLAPAHLSFHAARHMRKQGGGRIVNVSSRGAFRGEPRQPAYGASKAGLNALGQSLAQALAPFNVLVYTVAPGFVETPMAAPSLRGAEGEAIRAQSPFNRVARPEEVANAVVYLASEAPAFMTGCIVDVNGASYLRS